MAVSTGCHPGGGVLLAPGEQTPSLQPDSLGGHRALTLQPRGREEGCAG